MQSLLGQKSQHSHPCQTFISLRVCAFQLLFARVLLCPGSVRREEQVIGPFELFPSQVASFQMLVLYTGEKFFPGCGIAVYFRPGLADSGTTVHGNVVCWEGELCVSVQKRVLLRGVRGWGP